MHIVTADVGSSSSHRGFVVENAVDRILAGARWVAARWAEHRQAVRSRAEFNRLDSHALRDLGISRGDYDTYLAEARSAGQPTLRRTRFRSPGARHEP